MGDNASSNGGLATARSGSAPDARSLLSTPTFESLSLRLHACSPAEIQGVDDLLRFFELSRGLGWVRHCGDARHSASERFHEIREIVSGAIMTWCHGSMSVSDRFEIEARPALGDRCEACERTWVDQRFIERGLRELMENAYSRIGLGAKTFARELATFNADDRAGFELWLGPCEHGCSPITRCALGCAPKGAV